MLKIIVLKTIVICKVDKQTNSKNHPAHSVHRCKNISPGHFENFDID
jgi:hypothetical protein